MASSGDKDSKTINEAADKTNSIEPLKADSTDKTEPSKDRSDDELNNDKLLLLELGGEVVTLRRKLKRFNKDMDIVLGVADEVLSNPAKRICWDDHPRHGAAKARLDSNELPSDIKRVDDLLDAFTAEDELDDVEKCIAQHVYDTR